MSEYSVFEVTSSDQGNPSAGTAFAIDRVASRTYLVTCAHVIRAVGQASVRIDEDSDVRVEALGDPRRMLRVSAGIMSLYLGIEVMLLQRDDVRLCRHLSPPLTPVRVCGF